MPTNKRLRSKELFFEELYILLFALKKPAYGHLNRAVAGLLLRFPWVFIVLRNRDGLIAGVYRHIPDETANILGTYASRADLPDPPDSHSGIREV
ncbi:hypothetical protein MKX46_19340 [Paenibacillus sp. FSL P4-0113]|uniref:hypothetical protein n=1 Tax=Paenibacillus sp. FSL P4-0113 TaxID=2921630 RepID=UPI0030FCE51C